MKSGTHGRRHFYHKLLATVMVATCSAAALYLTYMFNEELIWSTRTIAGDNLQSTPWHRFQLPAEPSRSWEKLSRIRCSYLSCLTEAAPSPPRKRSGAATKAAPCPDFFRWIHADLSPWRASGGITRAAVESAQKRAAFRVVVLSGRLYVELYYRCVQSRAMFTIWGLLLLLDRFPGQVPDVDFMFNCMDRPQFPKRKFNNKAAPPLLLAYCSNKASFDIPFPDWSYWGWAEVNIGPWEQESENIFSGSNATSWERKRPLAQWKGNPNVGAKVRQALLACNKTELGAEVFMQDWHAEAQQGYKHSNLSRQCGNRYKIYAEGYAWSVSFKYIMACGSTLLLIKPNYQDFFMRGLVPKYHYWPVDNRDLCPSIKAAVNWGNRHPDKAEELGNRAQDFLRNELSMEHVYDYMLHFLQEYAKLQMFKPSKPRGAQLVCTKSVLCLADPLQKRFLERSLQQHLRRPPTGPTCSMDRLN